MSATDSRSHSSMQPSSINSSSSSLTSWAYIKKSNEQTLILFISFSDFVDSGAKVKPIFGPHNSSHVDSEIISEEALNPTPHQVEKTLHDVVSAGGLLSVTRVAEGPVEQLASGRIHHLRYRRFAGQAVQLQLTIKIVDILLRSFSLSRDSHSPRVLRIGALMEDCSNKKAPARTDFPSYGCKYTMIS